ncbi:Auxin-responsive GH3-related protein [Limnobaculum zhutongyuii]|uniref:Auxin-responsive GH3-related protein n=1 Tax=Limnobaculum zhutongyuii TaxID=2498113 RepID=A0A411WL57_9GAMM|nr:GH3 auxin-responsive promoter family protein [Limnobaculum zhutongyuii]QBH96971.1 Auxin-responsive GH3-related protein [Limnobaculum zhutongyuii]TQS87479.1 Auxin-responsive GH3-related protein [Limnobaculum zhutongyuii]
MNNSPWYQFRRQKRHEHLSVTERQTAWLHDCLQRNQRSAYGQLYGFERIRSVEDFQQQLPIVDYDNLKSWIDKCASDQHDQLFAGKVIAFEKTGGSHSGGKLIPYSEKGLDDFRYALSDWLAQLVEQFQIDKGTAYWALSPAITQSTETKGGIPVGGGDALYFGEEYLSAFAEISVVPLTLSQVTNVDDWQLLTLYYLVCRRDLRLFSVWSPSFLTQLLEGLQRRQRDLSELLQHGGALAGHQLQKNQPAADVYQSYLESGDTRVLWPQLDVISCWADASSTTLASQLMDYFPSITLQPKGLLATEAIITIPNQKNQPQLCIDSNFYEFIDGQGHIQLADGLKVNHDYQVIVTTNSGLYRYRMGDMVRCIGFQADVPLLCFTGRTGVVSDLVGEKLTESFVNYCLSPLTGFAMLCSDSASLGYCLLLDKQFLPDNKKAVGIVEQRLNENPQYAYARTLSQLVPLSCLPLEQPERCYLAWQYAKGKRLGDIKIPSLMHNNNWREIFQIVE